MDCEPCVICKAKGLHGHRRLRSALWNELNADYKRAKIELNRLERLLKEAYWYNFEVGCRSWRHPWYESLGISDITLASWYSGALVDAPALPISVLENELHIARELAAHLRLARNAVDDWAPGGVEYERLLRESSSVTQYDEWHRNLLSRPVDDV